jgi:hypothetical protein
MSAIERKATWVILSVIVFEGVWVAWTFVAAPERFVRYLGFVPGAMGDGLGWLAGCVLTALFVASIRMFPAVRENMFKPSMLKGLSVVAALAAAILEEVIFRRWIMDYLDRSGFGALFQVAASGIAFGVAHAIWAVFGRSGTALHAIVATTILGAGLAVVYLASGRSLAPCVAAHFVMTALMEPGMVLAAMLGQMGISRPTAAAPSVTA